jgi:hypothetical protein
MAMEGCLTDMITRTVEGSENGPVTGDSEHRPVAGGLQGQKTQM